MGENENNEQWNRALWGDDYQLLQQLINQESPPHTLQQLELHIRHIYLLATTDPSLFNTPRIFGRIKLITDILPTIRNWINDWVEQRVYDIQMMKLIRKSGALSAVLGAGATIAAGGPSWTELVEQLLQIALKKGHEIYTYDTKHTKGSFSKKARLEMVVNMEPDVKEKAKSILSEIKSGATNTERLMEGAQLCSDLFNESLFQEITMILYPSGQRNPSGIHRAIAKLSHFQDAPLRGWCPGWVSIINYNFDSLMNDALDEENIKYTFAYMRNGKIEFYIDRSDPNPDKSLPVIHLHGFTPRQPFFSIKGIDYVFSTSQYTSLYGQEQQTIIDYAMKKYISNPAFVALYVGCSFTDEKMNALLRDAAKQYPGRFHYALLKLPDGFHDANDPDALMKLNLPYQQMGIQPVWFYDYSEIPELLNRLA